MQHYAITRILTKLYETLVDRRYQTVWNKKWLDDNELALYATVNVSCSNYGYERGGNTFHEDWEKHSKYYLHFVIHKHHRVYLAITDRYVRLKEAQKLDYLNIGNHDSCYKDSIGQAIGEHYLKVYQEAWSHVPEPHNRPPIECDVRVSLYDCFGELFELVLVERERIKDEKESNNGYFDKLVSFKKFDAAMVPKQIENGCLVKVIDKSDDMTGSIFSVEHYEPETSYLRLKLVNSDMFYTCYTVNQIERI